MMRALGRALRGWRAGADLRVAEDPRFSQVPREIVITSPAFVDGAPLPPGTSSPPLQWTGVPKATVMLAIIVEDVDVPIPRPATHAVVYDVDPTIDGIAQGAMIPEQLTMGRGAFGKRRFIPATPLPGHGPHRYVFTLLAVDYAPHFDQTPSRGRLLDAIAGHALALGEITGTREA